jgi:hypothetical protein
VSMPGFYNGVLAGGSKDHDKKQVHNDAYVRIHSLDVFVCPGRETRFGASLNHLCTVENPDEKNPALMRRLSIFAKRAALEEIETRKKYSFLIKVKGRLHDAKPLEEADLISDVALKTKAKS